MIYNIAHQTVYDYSEPVSLSHHLLRLRPRACARQRIIEWELLIDPSPVATSQHTDRFGNPIIFISIEGRHQRMSVESRSQVEVTGSRTPGETAPWEVVRDLCSSNPVGNALEAAEFSFDSPLVRTEQDYAVYAAPSFSPGRPIFEAAAELTARIFEDFQFDPTATTIATPLHQVFKQRRGVCQDFAHFQIACLRSLGVPARYMSGYLETMPPPGTPRLAGADASHAWLAVFCLDDGWIELDPTNNCVASTRHITLGWGRDYSDISPVRGVLLGGGQHKLQVGVDVVAARNSDDI